MVMTVPLDVPTIIIGTVVPWYESYTYYGTLLNDGACHGGISIKFDEVKGDLGRATCGTTMTRAPRSMACMGMRIPCYDQCNKPAGR